MARRFGHRHSHRSRGPSQATLERMAMPQSNPFGYYILINGNKLDISTCHPAYSDNRITPDMLSRMTNEIETHPDMNKSPLCYFVVPMLIVVLCVIVGRFLGGVFTYVAYGIAILAGFGGMCLACQKARQIMQRRKEVFAEITARHNATTFSGVQPLVIRLSPLGT